MIDQVLHFVLPATRVLLPPWMMESPRAWAMLLAIGLQESRFLWRQQMGHGPARGFWQFERGGGTKGVMTHPRSKALAEQVLRDLRYAHLIKESRDVHFTLRDNDVLACAFARLLLWTLPGRLPGRHSPQLAWAQYLDGWRPGKPHPETWDAYYKDAWDRLELNWRHVGGQREWSE